MLMKELGLFLDKKGNRYIGNYFHDLSEVEILGPLDDNDTGTVRQAYIDRAESEEEARKIVREILSTF